jgi:hypothetical protein
MHNRVSWWGEAHPTDYEVRRSFDGTTFEHVATVGERQFTDTTLPAGSPSVSYEVTAVRSTRRGLPGEFKVRFGTGAGSGGAGTGVRVSEAAPSIRKAA